RSGGTPYGASHVSGSEGDSAPSAEEIALAQAQGRRLAEVAMRLAGSR
ncbi:MAG TPA: NAD(P)H-quinone oxidoreductase, partial [Thauera aminoaromatica]|nr:NAD(P)H-quinone oxidoreductase [Thauera aminoaromatica]